MKRRVCVLVSGGLDSCVLLAELAKRHEVFPVYVRHGLRWETAELAHLRRFLRALPADRFPLQALTVLRLPVRDLYGAHWSLDSGQVPGAKSRDEAVYLPGRNLLLLSLAAIFCACRGIGTIAIGSLAGNPFADATPRFFRSFAQLAGVRVVAPFRRLTKAQVIRRGAHLPLHLTFSCLNPQRCRPCGRCNKCAERRRAFRAAGVSLP
ncbi:MAG: 7-cyano-7-deazaguanine synthase [Verrucomicrobiae bacterium]|nr:7-cyano-7-deazaguanine synthase [Verrucomicrobiae bacterium]